MDKQAKEVTRLMSVKNQRLKKEKRAKLQWFRAQADLQHVELALDASIEKAVREGRKKK